MENKNPILLFDKTYNKDTIQYIEDDMYTAQDIFLKAYPDAASSLEGLSKGELRLVMTWTPEE